MLCQKFQTVAWKGQQILNIYVLIFNTQLFNFQETFNHKTVYIFLFTNFRK